MSSVAGGIRAGMAFVELKTHDTEFQASMLRWQQQMTEVGASMRRLGSQFGVFAGALAAPVAGALMKARSFDDAIREIQASVSSLTPDQLKAITDESHRLAKEMGTAPSKFANAFLALAKAGMPLEQALQGGAKAAVEFAEVGKMDVTQAAELMTDSMNVFKVSALEAGHAISSAADASSTDIQGMSQAMSQVGAVAGMANQNIDDTAAALAILAAGMLKGSDAGTSLKTMLLRLTTPSGEANTAMARLGLNVRSFVDAAGKPLPLPKIVGLLNERLSKLDEVAQRDALGKIFGSDAIRAASILTRAGTEGFDQMRKQMADTLPLAEKYKTIMGGVSGLMHSVDTSAELVSISFTNSFGPALRMAGNALVRVTGALADLIGMIPGLGPAIGGLSVVAGTASAGMFTLSAASSVAKWTLANLPFAGAAKGLEKLGPAAASGGLGIVKALGWAAKAARLVMGAIAGIGTAIASIGAAPLLAIAAAAAAVGGGLWWLSSTPSGRKTGNAKPKRDREGIAAPAVSLRSTPEEFQAAMGAHRASVAATAAPHPILSPSEEGALSGKEAVALLRQLLDATKGQRPAWT